MVITSICRGASNHDIGRWVQPWLLPPPYMVAAEGGVAISALIRMMANCCQGVGLKHVKVMRRQKCMDCFVYLNEMLTLSTMVVQE